jgi:hypothetical protein
MGVSIIRINKLLQELNLNDVIFPIDKNTYQDNAKQISIWDLKTFILSGLTISGGTGTSGTSGTSPCITSISNSITIIVSSSCSLEGSIDCVYCDLLGEIDCYA